MNDLFDDLDLAPAVSDCPIYDNGHKFVYDGFKSSKEDSVFSCICTAILNEPEDSSAGC